MLRTITQRIFVAVREADNGIKEAWGPNAREQPGYREALIDIAVCVNAAQAAFDLRQEVERADKCEIEVLYGVFSLRNHQVSMPVDPHAPVAPQNVNLAYSPTNPKEFNSIAVRMAELLKERAPLASSGRVGTAEESPNGGTRVSAKSDGLDLQARRARSGSRASSDARHGSIVRLFG